MTNEIASESPKSRGEWYKSSFSNGAGGSCVEVKHDHDTVSVRDSKDRRVNQPIISMPAKGWHSFLNTISHFTG